MPPVGKVHATPDALPHRGAGPLACLCYLPHVHENVKIGRDGGWQRHFGVESVGSRLRGWAFRTPNLIVIKTDLIGCPTKVFVGLVCRLALLKQPPPPPELQLLGKEAQRLFLSLGLGVR